MSNRPILTLDFETDPFEYKKFVKPFCCGLYDGQNFDSIWSPQCATKIIKALEKREPSIIYMHNGGKFDIFFMLESVNAEMLVINGRIVTAKLGDHEIRDSYAIIPVPLKTYKKDDIEIDKLRAECRNFHRTEILSYLRGDCVYLHELVTAFRDEFGDAITIGSAAMRELRKFHQFEKCGRYHDEKFRSNFFRGGRVQVFQPGEHTNKPFKIFDVNSMYPYVMKNFKHPTGKNFDVNNQVTSKSAFVVAEGTNEGAFAIRTKNGGLDFTSDYGTYYVTIHEWNAALETNRFRPHKVVKTYDFDEWICFDEFVDHFFELRQKSKNSNDKLHDLFYKLILNSAYGKFAQNPHKFRDHALTHGERMPEGWMPKYSYNFGSWIMWEKTVTNHSYFNVAIGASITGAARSVLLRGIDNSSDLLYCDTDSLICRDLTNVDLDNTKLGSWKIEGDGDRIAIAGKKMYACFKGNECIKTATKGARITPEQIVRVANWEKIVYQKAAPTFKLDGSVQFIEREIRRTA